VAEIFEIRGSVDFIALHPLLSWPLLCGGSRNPRRCGEMADAQDLKLVFWLFPVISPDYSSNNKNPVDIGRNAFLAHGR